MRQLIKLFALAVLLIALATTAEAAPKFFICEVDEAIILGNGRTFVRLTDVGSSQAFTNKQFEAPELASNQMMVIAVAAITANLTVKVRTDPDEPGSPRLFRMHLLFELAPEESTRSVAAGDRDADLQPVRPTGTR